MAPADRSRLVVYGVMSLLGTAIISSAMTHQRGIIPGIVAGIVFGAMFLPILAWGEWAETQYRRHPWLNAIHFTVVYFIVSVLLFPEHSLLRSAITALVVGLIFAVLFTVVRRRQQRTAP
ncbi:hypothetical protein Aph01nite_17960 [Acrocarpospora phusangensis]|uniref:Uncharacterized protein n=1 Tax=Acrocarpospora phusangensis TaxID=1070424 RepID=A0A919Q797_9ACTN|nr:hypothetical protein [Acrocarpospora phusangensis]GIH23486.1 hypothetical protein Aph01nite_17960 [Acrocarpospora phusangensis]